MTKPSMLMMIVQEKKVVWMTEIENDPLESNPIDILLVEDDPDHTELISMALHKADQVNHIVICNSGPEALEFLARKETDQYTLAPLPNLILLDLRMPGMDGLQVLKIIKADKKLSPIPICMLTTSDNPHDIARCYAAGANGYVSKPTNFARLFDKIQQLSHFWFDINSPPPESLRTAEQAPGKDP